MRHFMFEVNFTALRYLCPLLRLIHLKGGDSRIRPEEAAAHGRHMLQYAQASEIPRSILSAEVHTGRYPARCSRF